jgi:chloramphenicol O-acetyltransferase
MEDDDGFIYYDYEYNEDYEKLKELYISRIRELERRYQAEIKGYLELLADLECTRIPKYSINKEGLVSGRR